MQVSGVGKGHVSLSRHCMNVWTWVAASWTNIAVTYCMVIQLCREHTYERDFMHFVVQIIGSLRENKGFTHCKWLGNIVEWHLSVNLAMMQKKLTKISLFFSVSVYIRMYVSIYLSNIRIYMYIYRMLGNFRGTKLSRFCGTARHSRKLNPRKYYLVRTLCSAAALTDRSLNKEQISTSLYRG
jgi:hypothetical protein